MDREELDILRETSPWLKGQPLDLSLFSDSSKIKRTRKNTILYSKGDPGFYIYVVLSGRIEHFITSADGDKKIIGISCSGCILGELPMFDGHPHFCSARVVSAAVLYRMTFEEFDKLLNDNPVFCRSFICGLASKIRLLQAQVEMSEFFSASTKIARMIFFMCQDYGKRHGHGSIYISMMFTHSDICSMTGLSRMSVSTVLNHMLNEGILRKEYGQYYVEDFEKLVELCKT